ncbi:hypothetical protein H3T48_02190 [Lactobacillus sp. M0403]|nr:hypothetical protein [Lactobacillus sp. M0403]
MFAAIIWFRKTDGSGLALGSFSMFLCICVNYRDDYFCYSA